MRVSQTKSLDRFKFIRIDDTFDSIVSCRLTVPANIKRQWKRVKYRGGCNKTRQQENKSPFLVLLNNCIPGKGAPPLCAAASARAQCSARTSERR